MTSEFRAGFVSFVGRPNVGKSTLTNALVGEKIAITSDKPQTTRKAIRGIVHLPEGQLIVVDTPGLHRPRTLLGQRLNDLVASTLSEVDVIAMCFPAGDKIGPGDRFINDQLGDFRRAKLVAIVTKSETVSREALANQLMEVSMLRDWAEIIPVSAVEGHQLEELTKLLLDLMPISQELYPKEMNTDESIESRICELIREASLEGVRHELPHSLAVTMDEMKKREDSDLIDIHANIFVERDSQKGIVLGKGGERLKDVGTRSRKDIEALLGSKVFLSLRVKIAHEWQRDPKQLGKLGF
jgi:GTP-binding protein Era